MPQIKLEEDYVLIGIKNQKNLFNKFINKLKN